MSDMSHTEAEEALATGDEQDVYEAVEAEREESEAPPEEAAVHVDVASSEEFGSNKHHNLINDPGLYCVECQVWSAFQQETLNLAILQFQRKLVE